MAARSVEDLLPLRSILQVPQGNVPSEEDLASHADAVLLSLAHDGPPASDLRKAAAESLDRIRQSRKRALVRVNNPRTGLLRDDLEAIVGPALDAVLVNATSDPQELRDAAVHLRELELHRDLEPGHVLLFAVVDSARGVLRAPEFMTAVARAAGLVFDSAGYAWDIGARDEELGPRLSYARGAVVAAARAHGGLPLIVASPFQLRFHAQSGFAGAIVAERRAMMVANEVFQPNQFARRRLEEALARFDAARAEGATVARYGERVIDGPTARRLRQRLISR